MAKLPTTKKEKKPKSNLVSALDKINDIDNISSSVAVLSAETYDSYIKKKREEIEAEAEIAVTEEVKDLILKRIVHTQPIDLLVKEKKKKSFWDSVPGRYGENEYLWSTPDFPKIKNKESIAAIDSIGLHPKGYIATSEEDEQYADGSIKVKISDSSSKTEVVQQTGSKSKSLKEDPWKKLFNDERFTHNIKVITTSDEEPTLAKGTVSTLSSGTVQNKYEYGIDMMEVVPTKQNSKPFSPIDEKMPYLKKEEVPSKVKVIKKDVFYGKINLKDRQYITIGEPFISPITKRKYTLANVDGINDYVSIPLEEEKDEIK